MESICWYRFGEDFVPDTRVAAIASSSHGNDPNWYLDSRATDHITGKLEKVFMHERYNGGDQIHATKGVGMTIDHIGTSVIPTPTRPLHLNNVFHVPRAHKQLVSIHRFNLDNHTFIELHPFFFLIKDQTTKKVMLHDPCRGGLYPLPQLSAPTQKLLLSAIKPSCQRWHCRLGHPTHEVVIRVLKNNNILWSGLDKQEHVCDSCLCAKAHQLLYLVSTSQSTAPLELIFFDVWDQPLIPLVIKNIMLASLMIIVNSIGFTFFVASLMCFISLQNFNPLFSVCSIVELLLCRLTGEANTSVLIPLFVALTSPI
jgi:hypothetical protein